MPHRLFVCFYYWLGGSVFFQAVFIGPRSTWFIHMCLQFSHDFMYVIRWAVSAGRRVTCLYPNGHQHRGEGEKYTFWKHCAESRSPSQKKDQWLSVLRMAITIWKDFNAVGRFHFGFALGGHRRRPFACRGSADYGFSDRRSRERVPCVCFVIRCYKVHQDQSEIGTSNILILPRYFPPEEIEFSTLFLHFELEAYFVVLSSLRFSNSLLQTEIARQQQGPPLQVQDMDTDFDPVCPRNCFFYRGISFSKLWKWLPVELNLAFWAINICFIFYTCIVPWGGFFFPPQYYCLPIFCM